MIEEGGIGASGRRDRAGGWMLLHAPAAAMIGLPPRAVLFDRMGLAPDNDGHIRFASEDYDWIEGAATQALWAEMHSAPCRRVGLATGHEPSCADSAGSLSIAVRWSGGDPTGIHAIQRLCALVSLLSAPLPGAMIGWLPAHIWSSAALFADAAVALQRQGLPPVMHLVGFDAEAGATTTITTTGLAWFCGHELRLTAPSPVSARQAIRRAARLAVDALVHHGLAGPMTVDGIDRGETLIIGGQADGVVPVELRPPPG